MTLIGDSARPGAVTAETPSARRRSRAFRLLLLLAASLWTAAVFRTPIESLSVAYLPLLQVLPWPYWLGFAVLLIATAVWYFSPITEPVHFLLLFFWTLYLFIGPELLEANGRVNDTYDWLLGITYLAQHKFSVRDGFGYAVFPGYFYLAYAVSKLAHIGYYQIAGHVMAAILHLLRIVAILAFANAVLQSRRQVLLASLLLTSFLWIPGTHPSPHALGYVLLLLLYALTLKVSRRSVRRRLIFTILFILATITHPTSTLQVTLTLSLVHIIHPTPTDTNSARPSRVTPLLPWVIFVAWMIYGAVYVFNGSVAGFTRLLRNPFVASEQPYVSNLTPYRLLTVYVSLAYVGLLTAWVLYTALARARSRTLTFRQLQPLFFILPTAVVLFIPATALASSFEMFEYSTPFVVWFLVIHATHRRMLTFGALCVALLFSPVGRYANEAVVIFPTTEIAGARFLVDGTLPSQHILSAGYRPSIVALADVPALLERQNILAPQPGSEAWLCAWTEATLATNSITTANMFLYSYGERDLDAFRVTLRTRESGLIYTNSNFEVYAIEPSTIMRC